MDANPTDRGFIPYPTNRVVGTISGQDNADAALSALVEAGFDRDAIELLHGDSDLARLDPAGSEHGVLERLQRALIRTGGPVEEHKHLMRHVDDIRMGRFVLMVLAPQREARTIAADILGEHGAEFVGFYGRWMWEGLTPSSVAAADDSAKDARARAARAEDVPRLFVAAWNKRDPEAIASLFDSHAAFVNVTGLCWHDRAAIRQAHAYSLEHIFNASTLTIDELRVTPLSDAVAVVHAATTLSGQAPIATVGQPRARRTIFSFVVHRNAGGWLCASAHSTDIVPDMETNVIGDDGTLRAANYRNGQVS
jgi:uncharacterized protein (TIGR02246 family)